MPKPSDGHAYPTCPQCPIFNSCKVRVGLSPAKWDACRPYQLLCMYQQIAQIPQHLQNWSLNTYDSDLKSAKNFAKYALGKIGSIENVFLHGNAGSGKTTLACATLTEYMIDQLRNHPESVKQPNLGIFINGNEFFAQLKLTMYTPEFADLESTVKTAPLLVFDDITALRFSEFATDVLYRIFDHRLSNGLPTIVTSNFSPEEFRRKVDEYLASRVLAGSLKVNVNGRDLRAGGIDFE